MFKRYWTTCSVFVNHFRFISQHNWGDLYCLLITHWQWTLINHNNSRLAPKLSGIDPGFIRYICRNKNFNLKNLNSIRKKITKSNQIRPIYLRVHLKNLTRLYPNRVEKRAEYCLDFGSSSEGSVSRNRVYALPSPHTDSTNPSYLCSIKHQQPIL